MACLAYILSFLGPFQGLAANIGILVVLCFIGKCVYFTAKNLFVYFFAEPMGKTVNFKEMGEWAGELVLVVRKQNLIL